VNWRDWHPLLEGLLEAAWLVDPVTLQVLDVNESAALLQGLPRQDMVGKSVVALTASPEDLFFWEDVAAGLTDNIHSETLLRSSQGDSVMVERRVSRVWLTAERAVFLVSIRDLRQQRRMEDELEQRVAELRATLESTADAILVSAPDGAVRSYNRQFALLWHVPEALMLTRDDAVLHEHLADQTLDPAQYRQQLQDFVNNPLLERVDTVLLRTGQVLERVTRPQYSRGQPTGRVFSYRDITLELQHKAQLRLAAKVFDSSLEAIFITDPEQRVLAVNPACETLTGCAHDKLVGATPADFFSLPNQDGSLQMVQKALDSAGVWRGQLLIRRVQRPDCTVQVSWVSLRDSAQQVNNTICFFRDLTDELAAQNRIEQLAYRDALTGLPNRLLLTQRAEFALRVAERKGTECAVAFLDLDRFKSLNDSMGHSFGDRVLVEVARRLSHCVRDVDTLCRLGGDEFVVFVQDTDAHGAEILARRLIDAMSQSFQIDDMSFSVGCSIGMALYPEDGKTLDALIKCADSAMYLVKARGRGNFRFYQPQMNVNLLSHIKLDHAMRQALEKGLFRLHYQPQISLANGSLLGAEALLRWTDAELGEVTPGVFIPLAEETGFIISIGTWVLEEAVRQARIWQDQGTPVMVAVNVSALQFQQADFVDTVAAVLKSSRLAPGLLELELTESILIQDAQETLARLHALAALGVAMSIDDFGTGYSSLAYLKKFPISKLKIDRSFVTGLPGDEGDRAIVSATIGMARGLKLRVVAEGVETLAQRDYLADLGCQSFQGFLCSPALAAAQFGQLMAELPSASG